MSWKDLLINKDKLNALNGEETKPEPVQKQKTQVKTSINEVITPVANTIPEIPSDTTDFKAQIVTYFKKVFTENNIPGPDYWEFFNALEDQKSEPIPEQTKFKMIFTSFKTMGLTPERLIETANQYKALFATKVAGFDQSNQSKFDQQVTGLQTQIDDLDAKNLAIDKQMQDLIDQKNKNIDQSKELKTTLQKNKKDLSDKKTIFHEVYEEAVNEIDKNIGLIQKYLQ